MDARSKGAFVRWWQSRWMPPVARRKSRPAVQFAFSFVQGRGGQMEFDF
jgi:hypothetical protein